MRDEVAALAFSGVMAVYGKNAVERILGPTADYLGELLKNAVQRRQRVVEQVLGVAARRLSDHDCDGEVPLKVLRAVVEEGSCCEERFAIEYLGGVLASSKTLNGRDDRAARYATTVARLSSYQLRAHYVSYAATQRVFAGTGHRLDSKGREHLRTFMPEAPFGAAMAYNESELRRFQSLTSHAFHGLQSEGLIDWWRLGPASEMKIFHPSTESGGVVFAPSGLGAELFVAAFGHQGDAPEEFLADDFSSTLPGEEVDLSAAVGVERVRPRVAIDGGTAWDGSRA